MRLLYADSYVPPAAVDNALPVRCGIQGSLREEAGWYLKSFSGTQSSLPARIAVSAFSHATASQFCAENRVF
jgi:hypothetical protein